ncbi:MAG: hypothetical protein J5379_00480 [Clostridiales bacterium]|nr:hypothetical protein [Clostridiales bacterium]
MKNVYRNVVVCASTQDIRNGFDIYLMISGQRVYLMTHRDNTCLFNILKDGIDFSELKRYKPHRLYSRYGMKQHRNVSVRTSNCLTHLIRVVDSYLDESAELQIA